MILYSEAVSDTLPLPLDPPSPAPGTPVECLGIRFPSADARRAFFRDKLREKLRDPDFRCTEGFPDASDEQILALSDPPFYTACPNPFLADFLEVHGRPYESGGKVEEYRREPFAVDASEGKTDPLYTAHSYHTKVPFKAILPAILHYTRPDDVVLDGFAGSGMVGVAAQMCGTMDTGLRREIEARFRAADLPAPEWGARHAVLNDLGPAATFIAANYNLPFDVEAFGREAKRILRELRQEIGWMYETAHLPPTPGAECDVRSAGTNGHSPREGRQGRINYTVWSEVFGCPDCGGEIVFLEEALDPETKRVRTEFPCPHCGAELSKGNLQRLMQTTIDAATGEPWQRIRLIPVLINYSVGKQKHEKKPDPSDLEVLRKIEGMPLPSTMPINPFPIEKMYHGSRLAPKGFTRVYHLYLPRAAQALGLLWKKAAAVEDTRLRNMLLFWVEQAVWTGSILNRFRPTGYSQVNQYLTGVYYVASQHAECSPWYILEGKLRRLVKTFQILRSSVPTARAVETAATTAQSPPARAVQSPKGDFVHLLQRLQSPVVSTGTAADLPIPDRSIDYIFTDPPFGENIYYADLNFLVESWHRVWTDAEPEAIVDKAKEKGLPEYGRLMQRCFEEYNRVLKPGRWMTVVFHNSRSSVWNVIQEAMLGAGFVVASVRTLDKRQGSYRQVTSTAVKQDLVISAYKPNGGLEQRFELQAGREEGVWEFVRTHLRQLPRFLAKEDRAEIIAERQAHFLFDSMVSFHVQRGVRVPLSVAEFNAGLVQRFAERDGMFFLPEEVAEYDRKRIGVRELQQLQLFVHDEQSAIQWLRQELTNKPQTLQELTPKFMQQAQRTWAKHEKRLELAELLEQNFLRYDGQGPIPPQIASWLRKSSTRRQIIAEERAEYGTAGNRGQGTGDREQGDSEGSAERRSAECGVRRAELQNTEIQNDSGADQDGGGEIHQTEAAEDPNALRTSHPALLGAAQGLWYVPDPNRAADLEKLRERQLLKEFDEYRESKQRRLRVFRIEAVRAGFKRAWQGRDYGTIIEVAERISETVLHEDPKLLMWYDQARMRSS